MRRIQSKRAEHSRYGAAATEFALTAPVLILFALACMDFGRIAFVAEVVTNAARTGAETGGTRQFTSETETLWRSQIEEAIVQEMSNLPDFQQGDLETNIATSTDSDDIVLVTVDVEYPFRTLVSWPGLPSEVQLREHVQYRQFR
jgi:Flp pilus assembly protein TadG